MTTSAPSEKRIARPSDALSPEKLTDMLRSMLVIRRFEERTAQAYQLQNIGGFCHLYIGQEAVAVGSIGATEPTDPVITAYRDHGHALARGMAPKYAMAEMFGKLTGCSKGKGGSMHLFDKKHHMYGGHAIVGGQCPLGIGLAFASQYTGKDEVTLCYLGDGALNQGAFHEAMNMAAVWRLPILFIVENNMYSMGTHIARGTAAADNLKAKADAYAMRYAQCGGMDVLEVYDTFKREIDATRGSTCKALGREDKGAGPCFVNVETYRYKGHSMSDPQKYRTKDEVAGFQAKDPINGLVNVMIERGQLTQDQADDLDKEASQVAKDAVKYAQESPDLTVDELFTDVYTNPFGKYVKGELPIMLRDDEEPKKNNGKH